MGARSFRNVAKIGAKIAYSLILGANTIETVDGSAKGSDKRDLAMTFANSALGFCSENQTIPNSPRIQALRAKLLDAYVDYMNGLNEEIGDGAKS